MSDSVDAGDLLCLILDLNPLAWALSGKTDAETDDHLSLEQALDQILIFCNAHLALRHENQLAVFGTAYSKSRLLYSTQLKRPSSSTSSSSDAKRDANVYQQFSVVVHGIADSVKEMMEVQSDERVPQAEVGVVGGLAMALCHINRLNSSSTLNPNLNKPRPRILVLSVTDDASSQYVSTMNCIFTAQKNIFGRDAVFMQQACHLTSGSYFRIKERAGLLQYLIMSFLPGATARKHLNQPTQDQVDLRAACFCHRKIVDIGYVCSVCLSIFCSPIPVCSTCRTKFPLSTLKRFRPNALVGNRGDGVGVARGKKRKAVANGTHGDGAAAEASSATRLKLST